MHKTFLGLAGLALAIALTVSCSRPPADIEVTFLDVGQGDAALIRTPEGGTVVIDTGHNGGTAGLLRKAGVRRIDLLVLSHAHADHTGGLKSVARQFPIGQIWYSGRDGRIRLPAGTPAEPVFAGTRQAFGKLELTVLHPDEGRARDEDENDRSVVISAVYDSAKYLFPGDCELGCWDELFRHHRGELRADVLKAAHHGSHNGTNSGVLINVRPRAFVISCGRGNEYGHPSEIVTRMAEKAGARVFRTDMEGNVRCTGAVCE